MQTEIDALTRWLADTPPISDMFEARLSFLDTIGCMIAGHQHPVVGKAHAAGLSPGALVAVAAHVHDFDDGELAGSTHPSVPVVAALLEMNAQSGMSYDCALDAYCAGVATIRHFGTLMGYGHYAAGWHASCTLGILGATAACARLLSFKERQTGIALVFAAGQASGLKAQFGTDAKSVQIGQAAAGAVQAVRLAGQGLSANTLLWDDFAWLYNGLETEPHDAPELTLEIGPGEIVRKP